MVGPLHCPLCGHEIKEDASFCKDCGARLGGACRSCGVEHDTHASFCNRCGVSLTESTTTARTPVPVLPTSFAASGHYLVRRLLGEGSLGSLQARRLIVAGWPVVAMLIVLAVALAIRLYRLDAVPGNLTADETDFFREVYRVLEGNAPGWFYQGQPASLAPLGIYPMAWSVRVFGDSIVGLRMYTVILSLATLTAFFLFVRYQFSLVVSSVMTLLLSTNLWFLHFSRTGWANMNAAFIAIGVTSMLALGLERGRWWWFMGAGIFVGLAPWGYVAARSIPLIVAFFLPVALLLYRDRWRQVLWGFGLVAVVAVVIAGPVLNELRQGMWDSYTARSRTVSIFTNRPNGEAWRMVPGQVRDSLRGFVLLSNDNDIFRRSTEAVRYAPRGENLFDPVTRALFFVGLIASLWRWRQTALWWFMFLPLLSIQVFSVGTPDAARGLVVLPTIFLFVALGLHTVLRWAATKSTRWPRLTSAGLAALLIVVVSVSALNVRSYFNWMESDYALRDRGPSVSSEEFQEWSFYMRGVAAGQFSLNPGLWRERQDYAGCLTGTVAGDFCSLLSVDQNPVPLGAALVRVDDLPGEFRASVLTEISEEEFRRVHGGRNDRLASALAAVEIQEAWATVFEDGRTTVAGNAARVRSSYQAATLVSLKRSLTGQDYLGGPTGEQQDGIPLGDDSVLFHFSLAGSEWWQYFWREGPYIAQVQLLYVRTPVQEALALALLDRAARAQAERLSELAADQPSFNLTAEEIDLGTFNEILR